MAKEIEEQPTSIKTGIKEYIDKTNSEINIYNFPWKISEINSITLIGCGTAYHSCLMAKYWFEDNSNTFLLIFFPCSLKKLTSSFLTIQNSPSSR